MPITVKTPVYEGPLDLLLELVEKRKLLINDISLAAVTEEYLERVNAMASAPVGETAEFVALAATLLLIKSRSLLPFLSLTGEEERDIKELEYRLALYQIIKKAGSGVAAAMSAPYLFEGGEPEPAPLYAPDLSVTVESISNAVHALIDGFPQALMLPKVAVKKMVSLEEMVTRLEARVSNALRLSFKEFSGLGKRERTEVVVSFLALLELVKRGIIKVTQERDFGDIMLESDSVSTPTYE
ncbi:segregation/condensation protein A [Patescibacteria group bacterium]|nr:segregation/condensation protein A [Patescibacteria group bacterium]